MTRCIQVVRINQPAYPQRQKTDDIPESKSAFPLISGEYPSAPIFRRIFICTDRVGQVPVQTCPACCLACQFRLRCSPLCSISLFRRKMRIMLLRLRWRKWPRSRKESWRRRGGLKNKRFYVVFEGCPGGQPSLGYGVVGCPGVGQPSLG